MWEFDAERVTEAGVLVPIADMRGRYPVGTAEGMRKRANQRSESEIEVPPVVPLARATACGPWAARMAINLPRNIIQRFIPADPLPTGIGVIL